VATRFRISLASTTGKRSGRRQLAKIPGSWYDQGRSPSVLGSRGSKVTVAWIAVALVFSIIEVATVSLFAGFVALGAFGAAVAAFSGLGPIEQALVFAIVSLTGIGLVRRPLLHYLQRRPHLTHSGSASLVGQTALVVDPIRGSHERGHVRLQGEDWPALCRDGGRAEAGESVLVVEIRGATLLVDRVGTSPDGLQPSPERSIGEDSTGDVTDGR
jgi:membrane protein implicated in regulation of membrane protease activity